MESITQLMICWPVNILKLQSLEISWNGALNPILCFCGGIGAAGMLYWSAFFFASSRIDSRIEYVAFTLLTTGNSESDKSLKRFRIALKRKMTIKKTTKYWGQFFSLQNLLKFRLKSLLTFFSIQTLCNITLPPQRSSKTLSSVFNLETYENLY